MDRGAMLTALAHDSQPVYICMARARSPHQHVVTVRYVQTSALRCAQRPIDSSLPATWWRAVCM